MNSKGTSTEIYRYKIFIINIKHRGYNAWWRSKSILLFKSLSSARFQVNSHFVYFSNDEWIEYSSSVHTTLLSDLSPTSTPHATVKHTRAWGDLSTRVHPQTQRYLFFFVNPGTPPFILSLCTSWLFFNPPTHWYLSLYVNYFCFET